MMMEEEGGGEEFCFPCLVGWTDDNRKAVHAAAAYACWLVVESECLLSDCINLLSF